MIIKAKDFRKICDIVLAATDSSELSTLTETLELKTSGDILYLNVTNNEYYASVKFKLDHEEIFRASVNANLFLKLMAAITTEDVELIIKNNYLNIKANGNYKIPLIFENDTLLEVPPINIENKTLEMTIPSNILDSIVTYNSKQLDVKTAARPVQRLYYIDQEGCITFTIGACVNNFTLEKPVKILLNNRLVNLFKLFKNTDVTFSLGYNPISDTIIQTIVSFQTADINLTAITGCDDTLLAQVPATAIRSVANKTYINCVLLNTSALGEAINRLLLFSNGYGGKGATKSYSLFEFKADHVIIYDSKKENTEILNYNEGTSLEEEYSMTLEITSFKKVLDGCNEQFITLNFGDHKACVVTQRNVKNVIPEVVYNYDV